MLHQEFITIRVCNCHMVSSWHTAVDQLMVITSSSSSSCMLLSVKLWFNHNFTLRSMQLLLIHHQLICMSTAEMVAMDTIWQLHTLIVMNSWLHQNGLHEIDLKPDSHPLPQDHLPVSMPPAHPTMAYHIFWQLSTINSHPMQLGLLFFCSTTA